MVVRCRMHSQSTWLRHETWKKQAKLLLARQNSIEIHLKNVFHNLQMQNWTQIYRLAPYLCSVHIISILFTQVDVDNIQKCKFSRKLFSLCLAFNSLIPPTIFVYIRPKRPTENRAPNLLIAYGNGYILYDFEIKSHVWPK